jgi:DNA modification methylase
MAKRKITQGGQRKSAGRKPIDDKKIAVTIYVRESLINSIGIDAVKEKLIAAPSEKMFGKHPTQKPLALLKRIVKASTKPNDIIFDPFNGGGTTGIATAMIGERKYIGCDLNKDYIDLTIKRYEATIKNKGLFL